MKAKKSLGQNFLIDENVLNKINNEIQVNENDLVIEIGPGLGALTSKIKSKGCYLLCYEIDVDLKPYLSKFIDNKTTIVYKDILEADIRSDIKNIKYNKLYVVGNLPYYITTPIIKYLINQELDINEMILMVQDEVADRFSSLPNSKNYSSITLFLKYYYNVTKLFKVSKKSFSPIPKVESAIIRLSKRVEVPDVEKEKYFKLLEDSFKMKRKALKNNLKEYNLDYIKSVLDKYNYKELVRAEELPEEVFVDIAKGL